MTKNKKMTAGLIVIAAAFMIMLFSSMPSAGSKEVSLSDLVKKENSYQDQYVMTQGLLNAETIQWNAKKVELEFEINDEDNVSLPVNYQGIKPDNFSQNVTVIVEGFMNEQGVFEAEKVQTKCPSKYEGKDTENYDPEMHKKISNDKHE